MKLSIIIATYDSEKTLSRTLDSIEGQTLDEIEVIVIDGNSSDGTMRIVEEFSSKAIRWISEPDKGIYDAWNKGLQLSRGKYICFIGSDDYFAYPNALSDLYSLADKENLDFVSAKYQLVNEIGEPRLIRGLPWSWNGIKKRMVVAHPGSLHKRAMFSKMEYNSLYKIASDYELLLNQGPTLKSGFLNKITVVMADGGVSNNFVWKTLVEVYDIQRKSRYISIPRSLFNFARALVRTYILR